MSEHNRGVYVRLGVEDKQVLLMFCKDPEGSQPANISQWRIDPKECLAISEAMATSAFEAEEGLKPVGPALKASLVEQHRAKIIQRGTLMLGSIRGDKLKSDGQLMSDLFDMFAKEVF